MPLRYVYIIRSGAFPEQKYTGATADLKRRIADHNAGKSKHTAKYIPWKLVWYSAFSDKYKALDFEKYLKSHSGRAFAKKRLRESLVRTGDPSQRAFFVRYGHGQAGLPPAFKHVPVQSKPVGVEQLLDTVAGILSEARKVVRLKSRLS